MMMVRIIIMSLFLATSSSCSAKDSHNYVADTSVTRFSPFSDPRKYADLVSLAESGDKKSIILLISYFSYPNNPDLRNLLYWSNKQAEYLGRDAYTNYILALSNKDCGKAWKFLEEKYENIEDFSFYMRIADGEVIDDKCLRNNI